jgi:hypothetical protein
MPKQVRVFKPGDPYPRNDELGFKGRVIPPADHIVSLRDEWESSTSNPSRGR